MDGQEKSPVSAVLADSETGLGFESLQSRLQRYGAGKKRALDMSKYIMENTKSKWDDRKRNTETGKLATKIGNCADFLIFKRYLTVDEVRLHAANSARNICSAHFVLCGVAQNIFKFINNGWTLFYRKARSSARLWLL